MAPRKGGSPPLPGIAADSVRYFALVFGAGFVLGTLRVLWLAPTLGVRTAELIEMPVMLTVVYLAARHTVRRRPGAGRLRLLLVGLIALALLLLAELGVLLAQGLDPHESIAGRDPVSGGAYLASLVVYAVAPALLTRSAAGAR